jgi:hypothetical protein
MPFTQNFRGGRSPDRTSTWSDGNTYIYDSVTVPTGNLNTAGSRVRVQNGWGVDNASNITNAAVSFTEGRVYVYNGSGTGAFGRNSTAGGSVYDYLGGTWSGAICGYYTWSTVPSQMSAPTMTSTGTTAVNGGAIQVGFSAPGDNGGQSITSYNLYNSANTLIASGITSSPYTVSGLAGNSYTYKISAVNTNGIATYSNTTTLSISTVPATPSAPTATPDPSIQGIKLTWAAQSSAPANGNSAITAYYVYVSDNDGASYGSAINNGTSTTYNASNLTAGLTYKFKIQSANANGSSAISSASAGTTVSEYDKVFVKLDGGWDSGQTLSPKISGAWKSMNAGYVKVDGSWRPFYSPIGQKVYTTAGTYSWTCPADVTRISIVTVGGGGGGGYGPNGAAGGGGGGLGWKNLTVVPGNSYTVVVGAGGTGATVSGNSGGNGGNSYFINTSTVCGFGGTGGAVSTTAGTGGSYTGDGGGSGGTSPARVASGYSHGGGGAGGYSGNGSDGGYRNTTGTTVNPADGEGGGGNGGAASTSSGGGGGGVGIWGSGASGTTSTAGGSNGENGRSGTSATTTYKAQGGGFGGGGGGSDLNEAGNGGSGAVRIIWGVGREFPVTRTEDENFTPIIATGGTETIINDNGVRYKVHTFTTTGQNFVVSAVGSVSSSVEYLVVGGGGYGGSGNAGVGGGGGGAGGYRTGSLTVSATSYAITIGSGGTISPSALAQTSTFSTITSGRGGAGVGVGGDTTNKNTTGASGGGSMSASYAGGTGTLYGNNGGIGSGTFGITACGGGGGGGAAGAGTASPGSSSTAAGGLGTINTLQFGRTGALVTYCVGGIGASGAAANQGSTGVANRGNGGGGSGGNSALNGGPGGSGIVIIRYPIVDTR